MEHPHQHASRLGLRVSCALCGDGVQKLFVLQRGRLVEGREPSSYDFVFDQKEHLVSQALLCESCTDDVVELLQATSDDEPIIPCNDSIASCLGCASDIPQAEAIYRLMEVRAVSSRRGQGVLLSPAEDPHDASYFCLSCVRQFVRVAETEVAEVALDLDTAEHEECSSCTLSRCWRIPGCSCSCHGVR